MPNYLRLPVFSLLVFAALGLDTPARAGIPECRNLRLEDVLEGGCELRASGSCTASCDRLGIYEKACATKLHTVCRQDCTLDPNATCTESCTDECDRGVNITCIHNCFGECVGSCDAQCDSAAEPSKCRATCEATCDGECDVQCRPLVDGDCYEHCIECCGGSCKAQINMDCQETCQEEEFESCEYELEAECSGSCDIDGALFCDGEYMLSGPDMTACVQALVARGTLDVNANAEGEINVGSLSDAGGKAGCHVTRMRTSTPLFGALGLLALSALALGRARAKR
jgi:hypothetical protein